MTIDLLDYAAFGWFLIGTAGYQIITARPALMERSITSAVQRHRRQWMRTMADRDVRVADAILLGTLSQGNAFFASTTAIAIGGLVTLVGSGEKAHLFLDRIPFVAKSSAILWEFKVVVLIAVFVYAFFKFAWAFRLTHYTAIMMGATPLVGTGDPAAAVRHADLTARLNGLAADHSNSGLRSFYYAMPVLVWFFHPLLFMIATTLVVAILVRRDFYSHSLDILTGTVPADDPVKPR
jgi:uncharacterized membrane protein